MQPGTVTQPTGAMFKAQSDSGHNYSDTLIWVGRCRCLCCLYSAVHRTARRQREARLAATMACTMTIPLKDQQIWRNEYPVTAGAGHAGM